MRVPFHVGLALIIACGVFGCAAGSTETVPAAERSVTPIVLDDGWSVTAPAQARIDGEALTRVLRQALIDDPRVHAIVVERAGKLVAEIYGHGRNTVVNRPFARSVDFTPTLAHDARSVGKTVIVLLWGSVEGEHAVASLREPVLQHLPALEVVATPETRAITIEHLLSMSSGLDWREGGAGRDDEHRLMFAWSPARRVFDRAVLAAPGTSFNYNSGGTAVMAELIARRTGQDWTDVARERLFAPMGIDDVRWVRDFLGRPMAYTGLRLRPRDMAKLGRLLLDRGQWRGQALVPAEWIDAMLRPRLATGFDDTRYGLFVWTGEVRWRDRTLPWAAAFGNGGQRIFIVPALDLGVTVTGGGYGDVTFARAVHQVFARIVATVEP